MDNNLLNDFIAYDVNNLLVQSVGKEQARELLDVVLPEIKRTICKHYKLNDLKNLLGKVLINLTKGE